MQKIELLGRFRDDDGTEKFVFKVPRGIIEITWIKNKSGIAVFCLPIHHYCNLGCKFCHLTEEGNPKKEMTPILFDDLKGALKIILDSYISDSRFLFSFMGVGEPFLNVELVFKTHDYFKKSFGGEISLALATMMLVVRPFEEIIENVKNKNLPLKIHFSLHSPIDKKRKEIIPLSSIPVTECLEVLKKYRDVVAADESIMKNLSHFHQEFQPAEIHYTMINNINDSDDDLSELIKIGNKYKIPLKLLKFNPTKFLSCSPKLESWLNILTKNYGASVCIYAPPGPNIGSSCGQFTKHYYLRSNTPEELKEFEDWKKKYEIPV